MILKHSGQNLYREFRGSNRQKRVLANSEDSDNISRIINQRVLDRLMRMSYYIRIFRIRNFPSPERRTEENSGMILIRIFQNPSESVENYHIKLSGGDVG